MFGSSRFLLGLLHETPEAVAAQAQLWQDSDVVTAAWQQAASRSDLVRNAGAAFARTVVQPVSQRVQEKLSEVLPEHFAGAGMPDTHRPHGLDAHVAKLCLLMRHADLTLDEPPTAASLHDLGLELEREAIRILRETDNRSVVARLRGAKRAGFEGTTIDDVARHVVQQTFQAMDAEFRAKSPAEQAEMAARIATALRDLPPDEQRRIMQAAGLPDLTAATLMRVGGLASLGFGVSSLVSVAGFSAYTTLSSVMATVTGLVGVHLSFHTYMALTSLMAGFANPLIFLPLLAGGGAWMRAKANRSVRGMLFPTLVATSVLADTTGAASPGFGVADIARRLSVLIDEIDGATGARRSHLVRRYPGLGSPSRATRVASHVAG